MAERGKKGLSAAFVRTVTKAGKYSDNLGLLLVVTEAGSKRWVQRLTIKGKRADLGLGSIHAVTLAEAREIAAKNFREARNGGDPLQAKRALAQIPTFAEAARQVYQNYLPTWSNPKHAAQFISTLETYTFPRLGHISVQAITSADVLATLAPIWIEKHETARRVRQRIGTVMKWIIAQGWRQDNPADNLDGALPKVPKIKAHRAALPYQDVSAFLSTLAQSHAGQTTKLALEFLILTAARSGEVREAVWSEIDWAAQVWEIPATRMKMKRAHRVPLSPRALEILKAAQGLQSSTNNDGFIFEGTKAGRPLSDMTLSKLVKELGFPVDVHGFRTTFRTWVQEQTSTPLEVAEAALAHSIGNSVTQAYARSDLFEKRRALMNAWTDNISCAG